MRTKQIKRIIKQYHLNKFNNLKNFIANNKKYNIKDLQQIAELANNRRTTTSAYYTNLSLVKTLIKNIKIIPKLRISILDPCVGVGNLIIPLALKLSKYYKYIDITVNDINFQSIQLFKLILEQIKIPNNLSFTFSTDNFLTSKCFNFHTNKYDYIICNPPFKRVTKQESQKLNEFRIKNLAGIFLLKAIKISNHLLFIMPKAMLLSKTYLRLCNLLSKVNIQQIIDFGIYGFKEVRVETIGLLININQQPKNTIITNFHKHKSKIKKQSYITNSKFPYWIIYRNYFFDKICQRMQFNIFKEYRFRKVTNKYLTHKKRNNYIFVARSKNISRNGKGIIHIKNYDTYMSPKYLSKLHLYKLYSNVHVFLAPNMTYYPRIIKKQDKYIMNGSVVVLILKPYQHINKQQLQFLNSRIFQRFYWIAMNKSTRTLNINRLTVFWFGKLEK